MVHKKNETSMLYRCVGVFPTDEKKKKPTENADISNRKHNIYIKCDETSSSLRFYASDKSKHRDKVTRSTLSLRTRNILREIQVFIPRYGYRRLCSNQIEL